ncbi:DUF4082 domain-containing protein [Arthrobacter sp. CP30]
MTRPQRPHSLARTTWLQASILGALLAAGLPALMSDAAAAETTLPAEGWNCSAGFVAVTFDDGPDISARDRTSWILDTLGAYGAHATFFDLGERINDPNQRTRPDLVLLEEAEGHVVGNHSWDHPNLTTVSSAEVQSQLVRANEAITGAGVSQPALFRPPYGSTNAGIASIGESLGLREVLWDVNKGDTAATSPAAVSEPVLAAIRSGSVIVLHDWAPYTAEALPAILDGMKARKLCPGLLAPSDTYNAQIRSYAKVVVDPKGPGESTPEECPCSIFDPTQVPSVLAASATGPTEVGVRFATDVPGVITAVRFYKASSNTGAHPVRLWSNGGSLLASVTTGTETESGWQQVEIPGGVRVRADTPYVASYSAPVGRYSQSVNYFTAAVGSSPLKGLASTTGAGNGLYATAIGAFPTRTYNASNYWVDVVFVPDSAPPMTEPIVARDDSASTSFQTTFSATTPGVLSNDTGSGLSIARWTQPANGSASMSPTGGYTYTPASGFSGSDSFTYTVSDSAGSVGTATVRIDVAGPATVVAQDTFTRRVNSGWGTADLGGSWTPGSSVLSVDGQQGLIAIIPGRTRQAFLTGAGARDTNTTATVQLDGAPGGSGAYASISSRRVAESVEYRGTARILANGSVSALIYRMNGSASETVLGQEVTVPGLTTAPGSALSLRFTTTGTSPTKMALTVWRSGTAEPLPLITTTDSAAALQVAGQTGLTAALSSKSTTGVTFRFDNALVSTSQ